MGSVRSSSRDSAGNKSAGEVDFSRPAVGPAIKKNLTPVKVHYAVPKVEVLSSLNKIRAFQEND